jgi:serine/threonine protein kinase
MEPALSLAAITPVALIAIVLGAILAIPVGVLAIIYLVVPLFKAIGWLIKQVAVFAYSTFADALRLIGAVVTGIVLVPLTIGNVIIGRWSATAHYGRAIQAEFKNAGRSVYRLLIGNPARLLCLTPLTEGIERRIPEVMAAAPGADRPARRAGQFDGYEIVGSLAGGGSGGRLYVARPDAAKLAAFGRNGHRGVDMVVIKCFSMQEGTTLPQIVRENRALDAAKKLGLILEHDLTNERFHYVMRYVPGDSLNIVTQRLHAAAGPSGLARRDMQEILSYAADLLRTLGGYHEGGLWHKDVKPDNIIVSGGHAHLVDFGLVTPLRSSMTLTTHGTEYFRDPEMVRMALRGVKVHEVDGAKFDLYAVGAVLYSMIENSFPAHGGLSQISRPCPEALRWIVRRAMTDYDKRYASAGAMLADVETLLHAADPFSLRPAHLPSVAGLDADAPTIAPAVASPVGAVPPPIPPAPFGPAVPPPLPNQGAWSRYPGMNPGVGVGVAAAAATVAGRIKPDLRVTHWFSGRYAVANSPKASPIGAPAPAGFSPSPAMNAAYAAAGAGVAAAAVGSPRPRSASRAPASEQLQRARARAAAARERIHTRVQHRAANFPAGVNAGVLVAALVFVGLIFLGVAGMFSLRQRVNIVNSATPATMIPSLPVVIDWTGAVDDTSVATYAAHAGEPRLLVVCEWSKFAPDRQAQIVTALDHLSDSGFLLLGDIAITSDIASPADQRDTELVAGLRANVGTRLFLSSDARDSIRSWMDDESEADAVIWFNPSEPGKPQSPPTAWVVGSTASGTALLSELQDAFASAQAR